MSQTSVLIALFAVSLVVTTVSLVRRIRKVLANKSIDWRFERVGTMKVMKRDGEILIRSKYTRGIFRTLLLAGAFLALAVPVTWFWTLGGTKGNTVHYFIIPVSIAIAILAWGIGYFYREDELHLTEEECSFTSWVFFQKTQRRSFKRSDLVRMAISGSGASFGLRMDLKEGEFSFYAHHDLDTVRGAGQLLKPILSLPLEDAAVDERQVIKARMLELNHVCAVCDCVIGCGAVKSQACYDCGRGYCIYCRKGFCYTHGDRGKPCPTCNRILV